MKGGSFAGIDGCPAGWLTVELTIDGSWTAGVFEDLESLWAAYRQAALLLIDMPIGLADGSEPRRCDVLARQLLKPGRASSIFPAPVREVLSATDYAQANALQRRLSGRGLSRQTWALVPKIRTLDRLLRQDEAARLTFRESHPELCLAQLFGGPMHSGKKSQAGFDERMAHLRGVYAQADEVVEELMLRYPRKAVARDDIVDALVLAVTAWLSEGRPRQLPEGGDGDRLGIQRIIAYYCFLKEERLEKHNAESLGKLDG
ncbi:DUF429 domain-containing protein [Paenibacillus naphthalenovorans]|uniref:Uncharacterized protein n=1 Tax=Paenibacillus naphthalenovorans TaxID=162209 RepID=A0A0U2M5M1_9BACL|nr:DUF429 domain-containing protein [Paenibacillus naphthalenovorans]ALS23136.1 hypothetical protein IJ22_27630 [Paenibacillus naphthalenovorans]GCL71731.1 DUF429 domain-containing protein [Paenibacillus naphthalenovorans]